MNKALILGSASFGWNVSRSTAFDLLERWVQSGFEEIDAATNYPLNGRKEDFRASEQIVAEFIRTHGIDGQLSITMKVGALSNQRTPEINLSPSFFLMMAEEYSQLFGEKNIRGLMPHWDNRTDIAEIESTLEALAILEKKGFQPGLSGIKHPEIYAELNRRFQFNFDIELKINPFYSDLPRYSAFDSAAHRFMAYGVNAGGVKLDGQYTDQNSLSLRGVDPHLFETELTRLRGLLPIWNSASVRPPIKTMNQLGLIRAALDPAVGAVIVGANAAPQLESTLDFWKNLDHFDYADVYKAMNQSGTL